MASAGSVRAGRAWVEASLDDSKLVQGLRSAEAKLKAWGAGITTVGASLSGLGAAATGGLFAAAAAFAQAGSDLNDMSARTGLSVEALSALGHAAQMTGTDLATVEGAARKMQKNIVAAAGGSKEAAGAFADLGLNVGALLQMNPDQQFTAVANAIARVPDPTVRAASAMGILGKSGTALLPMIGDMQALTKEARDLGLVMSRSDAEAADALGDALDNVSASTGGVVKAVGSALAPVLTEVATTLTTNITAVSAWIRANKPLVVTAFQAAAGLTLVGGGLVALGTATAAAGVALGGIATGLSAVGAAVGVVLSPIGLVTAGLAVGAVAFFKYTETGGMALDWLGQRFGDLAAVATQTWQGMGDALAAGDLALAGEILWATLEAQWFSGVATLKGIWADWGTSAMDVVDKARFGIAGAIVDLSSGVQAIWAQMTSALRGSWGDLLKFMLTSMNPIAQLVKALGVDVDGLVEGALKSAGFSVGQADQQGQAALAAIGQDNLNQHQALNDQQAAASADRRAGADASVADAQAVAAQKWGVVNDLLARASDGRDVAERVARANKGMGGIDGIDAAVKDAAAKVDVSGSFNAAAFRGLGVGSSIDDKTTAEQKKTNEILQGLRRDVQQGGLVVT